MEGWRDGGMDGWMDGWTDGRTDGRMDGWMDGCVCMHVQFRVHFLGCALYVLYRSFKPLLKNRKPKTNDGD